MINANTDFLSSALSGARQAGREPAGKPEAPETPQQRLNGTVANKLGEPNAARFKPLTAEQAAGNILGFIERQLERDIADGATQEQLNSRLQAGLEGFKKGFNEARDQLEALGQLTDPVRQDIGKTYDLVTDGVDDLADQYLDRPLGVSAQPAANNESVNRAEYQYASAQSFRFELVTREGDRVQISAAASRGESQSYAAEGDSARASGASASSAGYQLSVQGELSEAERSSIGALIDQVDDLAGQFFSGDVAGAFQAAQDIGYDREQIGGFALNLTRVEIQRASAAYRDGGNSAGSDLQQRLEPVGQFIKDTQRAIAEASEFSQPQQLLKDVAEGLYGDPEAPGNRDGRQFADFLSELLDGPLAEQASRLNNPDA